MRPLILIILGVSLVASAISYILSRLKNRFYKYIPSLILLLLAIGFIIKAKFFSEVWEDLGFIVLFIIAIGSFISTFIIALLLEKWSKKK